MSHRRRSSSSRLSEEGRSSGAGIAARGRALTAARAEQLAKQRETESPRVVRAMVDPEDPQRVIAHPGFN